MSQADVLKFLEKNKNKYFSVMEIAKRIGVNGTTLSISCYKLRKHKRVNVREESDFGRRGASRYTYAYKEEK